MCTPIDCLNQESQRESVWDDEDTFGQNDEVTFKLCKYDEQEKMTTEEIKKISKCKNQSIDFKDDNVQSHSTQFKNKLEEKNITILEATQNKDNPSISDNAYVTRPIMVIYEKFMKSIGLYENLHEKAYILQVILESKI